MRRSILSLCTILALSVGLSPAAVASTTTYLVNETIGLGSVTGSITTDGTLGSLYVNTGVTPHLGSPLTWSLTLSDGIDAPVTLTDANSYALIRNSFTATPTQLTFDFAGGNFASFSQGVGGSFIAWNPAGIGGCSSGTAEVCLGIGGFSANSQVALPSSFALDGTVLTVAVPEPESALLLAPAFAGLALIRRRTARTIGG